MKIYAVIGANYGDEGKGLATAFFADQLLKQTGGPPMIVLANGGPQRGHTVESTNGFRHVFHHFGSHLLSTGCSTWIPWTFCVNPMVFLQEIKELRPYAVKVFCHPKALVTTPYDMLVNQAQELSRGDHRHGSTGMGIWTTMVRSREIKLYAEDLGGPNLETQLSKCRSWAEEALANIGSEEHSQLLHSEPLFRRWIDDARQMSKLIELADETILRSQSGIIFEHGQGLLLSSDSSNVHTTPSITGVESASKILDRALLRPCLINAVYVSRTYMTRHGAGPFPSECDTHALSDLIGKDHTNVPNPWQGSIRYGKLDPKALVSRIKMDFSGRLGAPGLFLTHADKIQIDPADLPLLKWISRSRWVEQVHDLANPLSIQEIFQTT